MSELLPCPFCGGEAHAYKNNLWHVACERAHNGCVTMSAFVTEAEAIEAWNTRAAYEMDGFFYLPKPKKKIPYTSEPMIERTEHGYKIGAIADVHERAVREWQEQLNDYIIGRICDVFRPERTCKVEGDYWHDHGGDGSDTYEFILSCGHSVEWLDDDEKPRYCPQCGARIEVDA